MNAAPHSEAAPPSPRDAACDSAQCSSFANTRVATAPDCELKSPHYSPADSLASIAASLATVAAAVVRMASDMDRMRHQLEMLRYEAELDRRRS